MNMNNFYFEFFKEIKKIMSGNYATDTKISCVYSMVCLYDEIGKKINKLLEKYNGKVV